MEVNRLSNVLGAEVIGLDLRESRDPSAIEKISALLTEHQLLVFRDQRLEPAEQLEVCRRFGELESYPSKSGQGEPSYMTVVSNVKRDGKQVGFMTPEFLIWHSDLCYLERTARATFLYAHTVPQQFGETWYANQFLAYDELPADLKQKVEGRRATFSLDRGLVERMKRKGWDLPTKELSDADFTPDVQHPVIRTHPISGRRSIFVNWAHVDRIEGYSADESIELLDRIFEHSTQERFLYRHFYRRGDLAVWDNASVLHSAAPKHPVGDRIMHRVVVLGGTPFYTSPASAQAQI